jgi:hypothetical protein
MAANPKPPENDPTPSRRSDRRPEPAQPGVPQTPDESSPSGQDDNLIGAERLPRKGDDE